MKKLRRPASRAKKAPEKEGSPGEERAGYQRAEGAHGGQIRASREAAEKEGGGDGKMRSHLGVSPRLDCPPELAPHLIQ